MRIDDIRNMENTRKTLLKMCAIYMKDDFYKSKNRCCIGENVTYCNDEWYYGDIEPKKVKVYYTYDECDRLDLWDNVDWDSGADGKTFVMENVKEEYVRFFVHESWRYGGHDEYEVKVKLTDLLSNDRRTKIEKIQQALLAKKGETV